ncbi:leucyl aminopeptidase family protein [Asticcacaulis sp. EMRT-3]|uniref:leucyl aminopeptidase family protein n=1 Tax=Asticcacaulis sp. EMRT-3 TaxID=3040349 RepID=UPI0024AF6F42|nr:leucyl aminopeptidase family protein [Asticcacaulis sp. EMRT-3]MDI7775439.1 leucyl aminopeptidase family protein [Asticcacaulis sp. EMRT-3]
MPKPLKNPAPATENRLIALFEEDADACITALPAEQAGFLRLKTFSGKAGSLIILPDGKGLTGWFGLGARKTWSPMRFRGLPTQLPKGVWALECDAALDRHAIHVAWALGAYSFNRYKASAKPVEAVLDDSRLDAGARAAIALEAEAHALARDLVNTPTNDMGPAEIETAARSLAEAHGADVSVITGDDLLTHNYPAVHAVGRAAGPGNAPRFIEIGWQGAGAEPDAPVIVLVGKGVAFDTGGLNIKPGGGMALMKKDMGGAAHALALAGWVMGADLPVRLHVLLPAVENAISGNAFRPGDILASRAGLSIEIGNTDAEGRLILADALARAGELNPTLTVDFATLTGAARAALGPEVIPFYTENEDLARQLEVAAIARHDPLWRMPLWAGYQDALESDIADIRNDPAGWAQAGSVTAALFLQRFAPKSGAWVHFDIYAWNPRGRAGYPVGAEAQTLRAVFQVLKSY